MAGGLNPPTLPPETQPRYGWRLRITETGGTVTSEDFGAFVRAVNEQLRANNFHILSSETILERMREQTCSS